MLRSFAALALLSLCASFTAACGSDEGSAVESEESALIQTKTIARNVAHPSGLAVLGDQVYFGSNKFWASGDPELDQQFAFWSGKFSRVSVSGGPVETFASVGPITKVRTYQNKVYYAMSDGCWIAARDANGAEGSTVYQDENCDPEWGQGPRGFEITHDGRLLVVHEDGTVLAGAHDGRGMKKLGRIRVGNSGNVVQAQVLSDEHLFILTQRNLGSVPQSLYKMSLETGRATKVLSFEGAPSFLHSDGSHVFVSEDGTSVSVVRKGTRSVERIATGFGAIADLASAGGKLYVADTKRDAIYEVSDPLTSPRKRKLAEVKGLVTMIASGEFLYYGTHAVTNGRNVGVIGRVALNAP